MDFAPLVEGNLPQRLVGGLRQIDTRMLRKRKRAPRSILGTGVSLVLRLRKAISVLQSEELPLICAVDLSRSADNGGRFGEIA